MAYIDNMIDRALALITTQFRGDNSTEYNNLEKLIKSFVASAQDVEDVLEQLRSQRNIFDAVGVQLDGIGEILGLERRSGEDDEDYRERLKYQSFVNASRGTPEELISLLAFITGGDEIGYIEYYPAAFQMSTNGTNFPDPVEDLVTLLQSSAPASVQYIPVTATYGEEFPFVFGLDPDFVLLGVTEPSDPTEITNLEMDTTDLLYINPAISFEAPQGGGFAEYGSPDIETIDAGKIAEVIQYGGGEAPTP